MHFLSHIYKLDGRYCIRADLNSVEGRIHLGGPDAYLDRE